jgi:small subunit ribosomal protein S6e
MAEFKLIVSDPKTRKSEVREVKDAGAQMLLGRKIGEIVDGAPMGLAFKIQITGGSDRAGFPMRADVLGGGKNYVLLTSGVGFRSGEKGAKKRKLLRGSQINEEIYQVNAKKVEEPAKAQ